MLKLSRKLLMSTSQSLLLLIPILQLNTLILLFHATTKLVTLSVLSGGCSPVRFSVFVELSLLVKLSGMSWSIFTSTVMLKLRSKRSKLSRRSLLRRPVPDSVEMNGLSVLAALEVLSLLLLLELEVLVEAGTILTLLLIGLLLELLKLEDLKVGVLTLPLPKLELTVDGTKCPSTCMWNSIKTH
jgi:hypothetical protein